MMPEPSTAASETVTVGGDVAISAAPTATVVVTNPIAEMNPIAEDSLGVA
jgi:hypothetical protein